MCTWAVFDVAALARALGAVPLELGQVVDPLVQTVQVTRRQNGALDMGLWIWSRGDGGVGMGLWIWGIAHTDRGRRVKHHRGGWVAAWKGQIWADRYPETRRQG